MKRGDKNKYVSLWKVETTTLSNLIELAYSLDDAISFFHFSFHDKPSKRFRYDPKVERPYFSYKINEIDVKGT